MKVFKELIKLKYAFYKLSVNFRNYIPGDLILILFQKRLFMVQSQEDFLEVTIKHRQKMLQFLVVYLMNLYTHNF
jgi:hypothetical protein